MVQDLISEVLISSIVTLWERRALISVLCYKDLKLVMEIREIEAVLTQIDVACRILLPQSSGQKLPIHFVIWLDDVDSDIMAHEIDCTHSFTTSEKFPTKEALLAWVREVCKRIGMVLMIAGSSDGDRGRRTLYVIVRCERGSHYVGKKGTKEPKDNEKAEWKLDVYSGIHNHNLFENLNGHSYTGRLSKERTSFVHTMKKAMVKPRAILRLLKEKDPSNVTGIKTVYNTISKLNFSELSGRSQLQLLFVKLKEDEYLSYHRSNELNAITDLLWIHPKCIKLAQSYPYVFIIDCTYKTNRYGLPFLEIVGGHDKLSLA
ncbi:PREDICTED: protein FAR1-RELATED SEQUENCE 5-like [Erythranthe guttata]|uniref:protein FAR1-RELATED SEQUENCE 5-like n=1 Tax=Erythranthe guttata TaxID=4155 RepID=UPI00064DB049|nr:PREDICTED: protein FAR1-RELATED SEQUENCE 5-like [Erythranthe guttata]|eukprot:XP_012833250.1 PREDICTED: protein FAR1-RELATED SEQUENCE 5-like [Erythranthe guttata]